MAAVRLTGAMEKMGHNTSVTPDFMVKPNAHIMCA
jgi:hypothetical protein